MRVNLRQRNSIPALCLVSLLAVVSLSSVDEAISEPAYRSQCRYGTLDQNTCGCTCGPNAVLVHWTGYQECNCDYSTPCTGTFEWRDQNQNCVCTCYVVSGTESIYNMFCNLYYGGRQYSAAACGCVCPSGKSFNGTSCGCTNPPESCDTPKVQDPSSCNCVCPSSLASTCSASGGSLDASCNCGCPSGKHLDGNVCVCDNSYNPATQVQASDCSVSCAPGLITFNGGCVQSDCATDNCREFISSDGTCASCPK